MLRVGYEHYYAAIEAGSVHNHRWDFATTILFGGYHHQEFRSGAQGATYCAYKYQSESGAKEFTLVPQGTRALRCVMDAYLVAGSFYTLTSEVLHRVVPDRGLPTASLVLEGPRQPSEVDIYTMRPMDAATDTFRGLEPDSLAEQLHRFLALRS